MPKAPLPPELERFVRAARPAIIGTVRPDGAPVTSAIWYGWEDGKLVFSMSEDQFRTRNIRHEPRIALTILGDRWYDHVSIRGTVVEIRDDPDYELVDGLAVRYRGKPYPTHEFEAIVVVVEITHWFTRGRPAEAAEPS
jgi:PPOX class probable F420-dependent enzyme